MAGLIQNSVVVALVTSIASFLLWQFWNGQVIVWDTPIDHAVVSSMPFDEAVA